MVLMVPVELCSPDWGHTQSLSSASEHRIMAEKECTCVHVCARVCARVPVCVRAASPSRPAGLRASPRCSRTASLCFSRFGVFHSVFTNLLLWTNSVLNESKHQLNEHKERLMTLGFGNITTGEW